LFTERLRAPVSVLVCCPALLNYKDVLLGKVKIDDDDDDDEFLEWSLIFTSLSACTSRRPISSIITSSLRQQMHGAR